MEGLGRSGDWCGEVVCVGRGVRGVRWQGKGKDGGSGDGCGVEEEGGGGAMV